jgi:hypothetical protein
MYFTFYRADVNPIEPHPELIGVEVESKVSYVWFRFHSDIDFVKSPLKRKRARGFSR